MCLKIHKIHKEHNNQPLIAKEDLKVWKVLHHYCYWQFDPTDPPSLKHCAGIKTPYRGTNIDFTQAGKCVLSAEYKPTGSIHVGWNDTVTIGVHGYYRKISLGEAQMIVHPAIIPKGTAFFIGDGTLLRRR